MYMNMHTHVHCPTVLSACPPKAPLHVEVSFTGQTDIIWCHWLHPIHILIVTLLILQCTCAKCLGDVRKSSIKGSLLMLSISIHSHLSPHSIQVLCCLTCRKHSPLLHAPIVQSMEVVLTRKLPGGRVSRGKHKSLGNLGGGFHTRAWSSRTIHSICGIILDSYKHTIPYRGVDIFISHIYH